VHCLPAILISELTPTPLLKREGLLLLLPLGEGWGEGK